MSMYEDEVSSPMIFTTKIKNNIHETEKEPDHDYLRMILTARVYDVAKETPLTFSTNLSNRLGPNIYLKREDLQPVFSFKCRGAYNRMINLTPEERQRGVIAVSAGNHAQGIALGAKTLGIKAIIVMPKGSAEIKWANVKRLGAEVILFGKDFDAAKEECIRLAKEFNYTFIHPYDDPYVIAGQGTVGVEILRQMPSNELNAIFVCVGGGGLIAGIAAYVKRIRPDVKIIGVNAEDSDGMAKSLIAGERVELQECGSFSDGTSIKLIGQETFRLAKLYVDEMITVTNDQICAAIKDVFQDTRGILEPSGALAVAGCKKYLSKHDITTGNYVAILSGANMDFHRLRFVSERARIGEKKEAILLIKSPEGAGKTITDVSYRASDPITGVMLLGFEVKEAREAEVSDLRAQLKEFGMDCLDISQNEIGKSHVKFNTGGRVPALKGREKIYRFKFQERPGAIHKFVSALEKTWNLTLMHYRNTGGDFARVLIGFEVSADKVEELEASIRQLGTPFVDETENPAVQLSLY